MEITGCWLSLIMMRPDLIQHLIKDTFLDNLLWNSDSEWYKRDFDV